MYIYLENENLKFKKFTLIYPKKNAFLKVGKSI